LTVHSLSFLSSLIVGIFLGFSIAAPPGPINATIANEIAAKKSWWAGFSLGLGAMTADGVFLVLTYLGWTELIVGIGGLTFWIYLVGGLVLILYAVLILRRSKTKLRKNEGFLDTEKQVRRAGKISFITGLSMGLSNPYQIAWWLTVGLAAISSFGAIVALGFFLGIVSENLIFTKALSLGFSRIRRFENVTLYATSIVLIGFGVWFVYVSFNTLI
jgi:threonine/homoserine/homoserine lactone efflux protein